MPRAVTDCFLRSYQVRCCAFRPRPTIHPSFRLAAEQSDGHLHRSISYLIPIPSRGKTAFSGEQKSCGTAVVHCFSSSLLLHAARAWQGTNVPLPFAIIVPSPFKQVARTCHIVVMYGVLALAKRPTKRSETESSRTTHAGALLFIATARARQRGGSGRRRQGREAAGAAATRGEEPAFRVATQRCYGDAPNNTGNILA